MQHEVVQKCTLYDEKRTPGHRALSCPANGIFPGGFSLCACTFPWGFDPGECRTDVLFRHKSRKMPLSDGRGKTHLLWISYIFCAAELEGYNEESV